MIALYYYARSFIIQRGKRVQCTWRKLKRTQSQARLAGK